jgi:hypothetical protein
MTFRLKKLSGLNDKALPRSRSNNLTVPYKLGLPYLSYFASNSNSFPDLEMAPFIFLIMPKL